MNEQSSKKILFNKSSLLSLKAELLKKQEEVLEKKLQPQNRIENFKPPLVKSSNDETGIKEKKKTFKDGLKAVDTEELEACRKSKLVLEKKAELYEHLTDSAGNSQLAGRFLVDFKAKKDEDAKETSKHTVNNEESEEEVGSAAYESDADEWTEFTDCLGRTRKCHKSDLEMYLKRDKDLKRIMFDDPEGSAENCESSDTQEQQKEKPFLVQKTNDYLQSLRQKWEQKERELLAKDKDIHYQDLLFDEARIHGVGYYAFSTDETERQKQMEELVKQREATLEAQKQTEESRKKREEILAARVKAARARQRIRAGLPPEDPEENQQQDFATHLLEFLTKQRNEADVKAKEEEKRKKEELEKERQKLREAYIREWDLGKEGVADKIKKFREMTQEEYVDQQRDKRIEEFAPPKASSSGKCSHSFDDRGKMVGTDVPAKTWSDVRPNAPTPPPPDITNLDEQKGLYFSTKKQGASDNDNIGIDASSSSVGNTEKRPKTPPPPTISKKVLKYKNYFVKAQEPTPIVDELCDNDVWKQQCNLPNNVYNEVSGTEIAPPPTYEYYGPVPKKQKFTKPFESDVREAYAQGTKSLEAKPSSRQIAKDYDFMYN